MALGSIETARSVLLGSGSWAGIHRLDGEIRIFEVSNSSLHNGDFRMDDNEATTMMEPTSDERSGAPPIRITTTMEPTRSIRLHEDMIGEVDTFK